MPLGVPTLDDRRLPDLLAEALARAATHNPEWTSFQPSDPGVTILEGVAFLVEALLYRANRIPERDRAKFLSLLGVPLAPARPARAVVAFSKKDGRAVTLAAGAVLDAGPVPFRTAAAVDVLAGEARAVVKRTVDPARAAGYRRAFDPLRAEDPAAELVFYEPAPLPPGGLDLAETADRAVWLALLAPEGTNVADARAGWAGKTLGLGLAPLPADRLVRELPAGGAATRAGLSGGWEVAWAVDGATDPVFRTLRTIPMAELLDEPAAYEVFLPADLGDAGPPVPTDPFDEGSGAFPPKLAVAKEAARLAVWLRLQPSGAAYSRVRWVGINAVAARQEQAVRGEPVGPGTGEPDQEIKLAQSGVVPGSVRIAAAAADGTGGWQDWAETDDLLAAGPETPAGVGDADPAAPSRVFVVDPEAGTVRFGDGLRGARPADGVVLRADYAVSAGRAGNVGAGQLKPGAGVPAEVDGTNPLPAWGGGDAQTPADAEKLVPQAVRHRERAVTAEDYRDLALATPGAGVGRADVLPLYSPIVGGGLPGEIPGAVTLLLVPRDDPARPDAPTATAGFLDAVCSHLDPRRPVTAEVYLRGPEYVGLAVSVGFELQPGFAAPDVRDRLTQAVKTFLSPLPADGADAAHPAGWPLQKPVNRLELLAAASRVRGVRLVNDVQLATGALPLEQVTLVGLQLPRVDRLSVAVGPAVPVSALGGQPAIPGVGPRPLPVPVVPREC